MKIEVQIRSKYGRDLIYPVNDAAFKLVALLGKKTFSDSDIEQITALGIKVEYILRSLDLKTLG